MCIRFMEKEYNRNAFCICLDIRASILFNACIYSTGRCYNKLNEKKNTREKKTRRRKQIIHTHIHNRQNGSRSMVTSLPIFRRFNFTRSVLLFWPHCFFLHLTFHYYWMLLIVGFCTKQWYNSWSGRFTCNNSIGIALE